jgi:metal-responsive CopG/Arc/MetJ family transcriptional regulator
MGGIKTAISLEKPLFEKIEALAKELRISRSRLFVLAAQDFLERHRNRELLKEINNAYSDMPTAEEDKLLAEMRERHTDVVKEQW